MRVEKKAGPIENVYDIDIGPEYHRESKISLLLLFVSRTASTDDIE